MVFWMDLNGCILVVDMDEELACYPYRYKLNISLSLVLKATLHELKIP